MGNTANVKLGVCNIRFGGIDLGLTKGGVEVEVSTDTHKVMVDQFGESEINEQITKRTVKVTAPLAETTLENMVSVMPGAVLVDSGTKQVYTIDEPTPVNDALYTVTVNDVDYEYTADADATEAEIIAGLADAINLSGACPMVASTTVDSLILTARASGVTNVVSTSGGTLAGVETVAAVAGAKRVDVKNGVGTDLLAIAKELVLHPISLPFADRSEDFIIPLASTAGGLNFAYKMDEERVYNVEFAGYPNSNTSVLFKFGDPAAA